MRKYSYQYDNLNRLLKGTYQKPSSVVPVSNSYNEELGYDKNGNIQYLLRNGDRDSDLESIGALPIDDLIYTYKEDSPNQLVKVLDKSAMLQGFKDDSDGITDLDDDYSYDDNGNLKFDANKQISLINYNHLNLPTKIQFVNGNFIEYIYTANGMKFQKKVIDYLGGTSAITEYLSSYQYKGGQLQFFPHPEGYVNVTNSEGVNHYNYVFNYTDHLGNIRLSYGIDPSTGVLKIIEENHYYPFGLKHTNYNSDQLMYQKGTEGGIALKRPGPTTPPVPSYKYKYNSKEWQDELGLNVYDYGAMMYDPATGRRNNLDQLAEKMRRYSPYSYCFNNPIRFTDPDGMSPQDSTPPDWFVNNKTGKVVHVEGQSKLTQATADKIGAGDAKNYDRLGADNMFGNNEAANSVRELGASVVENPEKFMNNQGYEKAENVKIKETEFVSGGAMDGGERITQTTSDLNQIGPAKVTYAKSEDLNQKTILGKTEGKSAYSSSRSVTYGLTKPFGQDNHVTAEYYSNRSTNISATASVIDKAIHVIKAILKSVK